MTPIEIGLISVIAIVFLIYSGVNIPVALGVVSFLSIWFMRDNFTLALNLLKIAVGDSAMEYSFATIPLFTFMGLIVSKAGLGKDIYEVMTMRFRKVKGGIGMATVGANAVFAAVTGSSIASASVFTKVSVPQMMAQDYNPRFAVGVVAGSSVLGMIIPPSAMLIIYSFVAEQSAGDMFLAGVIPGILLAIAYVAAIWFMGRFTPGFVGGRTIADTEWMTGREIASKPLPTIGLIIIVLGGIYTGWMTAVEAGATGVMVALIIVFFEEIHGSARVLGGAVGDGPYHRGDPVPDYCGFNLQPDVGPCGSAKPVAGPVGRKYFVFLDNHVALRCAHAVPWNAFGYGVDHPDRCAAVSALGRSIGPVADLVRYHHRGWSRDRFAYASFRDLMLGHQINDQR